MEEWSDVLDMGEVREESESFNIFNLKSLFF
jgi:hypothetical protein